MTSLPIVPIDFRRDDQIVSYNVLRQRPAEPSVIIDNFVKAMAYVWGQAGTDETPLFERWATNTLHRLYNEKKTLADAAHLFTPEGLVEASEIEDPMIRQDWLWARRNRKDFEIATSSSINRFRRFLLNPPFADDAILVTHFDANPDQISTAIAPGSASDIGDRMILVPQELNPDISDEDIRTLAVEQAADHNVVVIVPSMGRGVRATDDFCVVLLMGGSLIGNLFSPGGISRFSPATRAQFELSEKIGDQIRGKGIAEIAKTIEYCLNRNPEWVNAAKSALVHVKYATASSDLDLSVARRQAFDLASHGDATASVRILQEVVNATADKVVKGWLMSEMAEYDYPLNAVESQEIQKAAHALNRQLIRPLGGIEYLKVSAVAGEQAIALLREIQKRYKRPAELLIAAHRIADDMAFAPDSYKKFQRAFRDAALLLGFGAQLPESEFGAGPDVLWAVGGLHYFVIECKNEATTDTVNKKDANQLAGSMNWFRARYDRTCSAIPLIVHPSNVFERAATAPPYTMVMNEEGLMRFKDAFIALLTAISRLSGFGLPKEIASLLATYKLIPDALIGACTVAPKSK